MFWLSIAFVNFLGDYLLTFSIPKGRSRSFLLVLFQFLYLCRVFPAKLNLRRPRYT